MGKTLHIPIAKAGKGVTFDVDSDVVNDLPTEIFEQIIEEGLKALLNSRMSKLAAPSKLEGKEAEDNKAAALAKAEENLTDLKAGKLVKRTSSAGKSSVPREVMTEATRAAKEVVKNEIRKAGMKPSRVEASVITKAAKALIESDPQYIEAAKAVVEERGKAKSTIDIKTLVAESPKLVAKAEKAKAERKTQLSAKQAGKTAKVPPRKPQAEAHATTH